MATVPALTDRTPAQRWAEVKDEEALWGDLRPELLAAVRTIVEATMEDGLTARILAGRYERTRARLDQRNGIYRRLLVTELGATELDVPHRRLVPYHPSFRYLAEGSLALLDRNPDDDPTKEVDGGKSLLLASYPTPPTPSLRITTDRSKSTTPRDTAQGNGYRGLPRSAAESGENAHHGQSSLPSDWGDSPSGSVARIAPGYLRLTHDCSPTGGWARDSRVP